MAFRFHRFTRTASAAAVALLCALPGLAGAQGSPPATSTVTITGRSSALPGIAGFGDAALARSPLQASQFGAAQLADAGVRSLGDLTRLDASLGDAYNAEGYWSIVSSRGYTLDNRANYRRDGLPINAETAIALDNKERLELLKGASGIQAGTSAPGGLVNLVVKRPAGSLRSARVEWRERGSLLGAVDLGERFGVDGALGLRMNLAAERLDPPQRRTQGERWLGALAADWQLGPDTLLQAELESSHQRQPSVAGFSLLGDRVPDARGIDPKLNLNDQPWRQPVVLDGNTASLRWQQALRGLGEGWRLTAQATTQRLKSDDRTAFPYGVYDANYECSAYCDRFAPDGRFTYWEYISNNERRSSDAVSLTLAGRARTGAVMHAFEVGLLHTRFKGRFEDQVFDIAGTGRIDGSLSTPQSSRFTDANTNRSERSTEVFVRDSAQLAERWQLWAGLRITDLQRSGVRTSPASDGLRATDYGQRAAIPWLALSHDIGPRTLAYLSWGQGLESDVAPNRARYINRGQPLPALKSRQFEIGLKHAADGFEAAAALFDIDRPQAADRGACSGSDSCTRAIDGSAWHRGAEAQLSWQLPAWTWQASAMLLDAQRRGSQDASVNGQRPVNVPQATLRLGTEYRLPAVRGLALLASVSAEGKRVVLPYDAAVTIPGWQRLDLGLRWKQEIGATAVVWRAALDNAANHRGWKESPYQFGHVYLYPLAPRALRLSAQSAF